MLLALTYFEAFKKPALDIVLLVLDTFLLFLASHVVRMCMRKLSIETRGLLEQVLAIVPMCIVSSLFVQAVQTIVLVEGVFYASWSSVFGLALFGSWVETLVVITLWTSLYVAIKNVERTQLQRIETAELNLALKESELKALRAQLNPHFLFNCLNNIRAVILSKPDVARETLTQLSDILRYAIVYSQKKLGALEDELEIVQDYLDLEKLQFGPRLEYTLHCPEKLHGCKIPPMSIQLLVENGIKHGIANRIEGGVIGVDIRESGGQVDIRVENSGTIVASQGGTGIGIANLKERLLSIFEGRAAFDIHQLNKDVVQARLQIPLEMD